MTLTSVTASVTAWGDDLYGTALRTGHGPLFLRRADGWLLPLDVERWCARVDDTDLSVLRRCSGPVLDVGCGPGRFVAALDERGTPALGIDLSPDAVARTVDGGGSAECRSVFDPLPGEGTWGTVLLMDGNIGIGGDPAALLRRTARLVRPGGLLLAEVAPVDVDERLSVRVDNGRGERGHDFPWARVGAPALRRLAEGTGWTPGEWWTGGDRAFLALRCPRPRSIARIRPRNGKSRAVPLFMRRRWTP
ncbi:methyltransferase domain-containing protein [Phytomonospora endophytica]|uniref:SAM-dependent methyltransferase n=1 Tax=Phytomonospora endophytica TaxID=714109 RepID=A0A841FQU9_9ACTN|nr:methyltransferase domain-containing protein [Phytomonospora endophytica]MBB6039671.1 SAM-dependent methyltransferase [Phytomonospora endophytica]GIG65610.1 methyltransferase type 11 [Phytomonospora endophytica]